MTSNNANVTLSANDAWKKILQDYDILNKLKEEDLFIIKASEIKKYKEPRLMAKWDNSNSLPKVLKNANLNILPISRSAYVIGDFILYKEIPELVEKVNQMPFVQLPEYESIDVNNITSEANAINVLVLSGILDDFLGTDSNISTFNGRMGTGKFNFYVNSHQENKTHYICVESAQCEIDGGFENDTSVVIMEAKNVILEDFHIRQLYYPFRLWKEKVQKPIRLVFSMYSNKIFRLFEYKFEDEGNYSSIKLVCEKNYSLQDTTITISDLEITRNNTEVKTNDNQNHTDIPFIQADSMNRIISLLENLFFNPMTIQEIASLMEFERRQADYYFSAGQYLGLFEKFTEDKQRLIRLSTLGNAVFKENFRERQLNLVSLILNHQIFADFFDYIIKTGDFPSKEEVIEKMKNYNVCSKNVLERRSSSVISWLKWIFTLPTLSNDI